MNDITVEKLQVARMKAMADTEVASGRMSAEQREGFRLGFLAGAIYGIEIAKEVNEAVRQRV